MIRSSLITLAFTCIIGIHGSFNQDEDWSNAQSLYDFHARDLYGNDVAFDKYRGHVVIVYNGATHCPVSSRIFGELQELQDKYGSTNGLKIVAFVIDGIIRESGTAEEIQEYFKSTNFSFDVYEKVLYFGDDAHPVYKWMKSQFNDDVPVSVKVLIDKNGKIVSKYAHTSPISELEDAMKQYF